MKKAADYFTMAIRQILPIQRAIIASFLVVWGILFTLGLNQYQGSSLYYVTFSFVFLALFVSGFFRQLTYGYLFLVVFLWLGFWLKITVHQIFIYPYGEPAGGFDSSPEAWDLVLQVAISGGIGVLVARLIYGAFNLKSTLVLKDVPPAPPWYPKIWKYIWVTLILVIIAFAVSNVIFGIQQSGLVPRTILIWPLNASIYWMLSKGFALCVLTLLWWHLSIYGRIMPLSYAILFEAAVSTVSLLSRGVYVFHTVPAIVSLFKIRTRISDLSALRIAIYILALIVLFLASLMLVSSMRQFYFSGVQPTFIGIGEDISPYFDIALKFSVDRWIGAEGVMAISSYDRSGFALFWQALIESSEIGKVTFYQEVSLAQYVNMDATKFNFATLPGAIAFFYYSGSMLFVTAGMALFTFLLLFSEKIISTLINNPLVNSFWGITIANTIAQFGVAPQGIIPSLIMFFVAFLGIWSVQSHHFTTLLHHIGLFRSSSSK